GELAAFGVCLQQLSRAWTEGTGSDPGFKFRIHVLGLIRPDSHQTEPDLGLKSRIRWDGAYRAYQTRYHSQPPSSSSSRPSGAGGVAGPARQRVGCWLA